MKNGIKLIVFMFIGFIAIGCFGEDDGDSVLSYPLHGKELHQSIATELTKKNIWFRIERNGNLTFLAKDKELVLQIVQDVVHQAIPPERSFIPRDQRHKSCVISMLEKDDIKYTIVTSDGVEWIVLKEGEVEPYMFACDEE